MRRPASPPRTDRPPATTVAWPPTFGEGDIVIARQTTPDGVRFVIHSRRGPQVTCRTYDDAGMRARSHAELARVRAWRAEGRRLYPLRRGPGPSQG